MHLMACKHHVQLCVTILVDMDNTISGTTHFKVLSRCGLLD